MYKSTYLEHSHCREFLLVRMFERVSCLGAVHRFVKVCGKTEMSAQPTEERLKECARTDGVFSLAQGATPDEVGLSSGSIDLSCLLQEVRSRSASSSR